MGRCFLKGLPGDAINATLAAAGANLLQLLRLLYFAMWQWDRFTDDGVPNWLFRLADRRMIAPSTIYSVA